MKKIEFIDINYDGHIEEDRDFKFEMAELVVINADGNTETLSLGYDLDFYAENVIDSLTEIAKNVYGDKKSSYHPSFFGEIKKEIYRIENLEVDDFNKEKGD